MANPLGSPGPISAVAKGFSYEKLSVGQTFGPHLYPLTRESIEQWCRLHGQKHPLSLDSEEAQHRGYRDVVAPSGMAFIFSLQALTHLDVMPAGVILAGKDLHFYEPPCAGDTIETKIKVAEKYIKRDRQYIILEFISRINGDAIAVVDRMSAIWPV